MSKKGDKGEKALFVQRLIAFLIDVFFVSLVVSFISMPFVDSKKNDTYQKDAQEIIQKFQAKEISMNDYVTEYTDVYYKIARNNGISSILSIFFGVLYFIVFQLYNNGQTLGKKLLKIKVVSKDGELFTNQMIYRGLLANFILVDLITFCLMLFSPKILFVYGSVMIEMIQYVLVFVSIIMVMFSKEGCAIHDKLAHTKVIRV